MFKPSNKLMFDYASQLRLQNYESIKNKHTLGNEKAEPFLDKRVPLSHPGKLERTGRRFDGKTSASR